jgi:hypothetical protein
MTEMVNNGEGQSSSNFAGTPANNVQSTPSSAPTERTFTQNEVNDLMGRARHEAVERYRREGSMESRNGHQQPQQAYQQPQYGYQQPQPQPQYQPPYQQQPQHTLSEDQYRRIAAEESQKARNDWIQESARNAEEQRAQGIAQEFYTKVGAGEGGIQGFEKLCADTGVDLRSIPFHVQLANMVENTRDVMVELVNNPSKIGQIQNLIDIDLRAGRQPRLALAEMKRLGQSLKENAQAKNFKSPNEPLSQMRPSNAGTGNQGALTASDYRRKYRV